MASIQVQEDGGSPIPSLVLSLASNMCEVSDLATSRLLALDLPLIPPVLSRAEILRVLQRYRDSCQNHNDRMALLLLVTDLVAVTTVNPELSTTFQAGSSSRAQTNLFTKLGSEWTRLFRDLTSVSSPDRLHPKCAQALHSALHRCLSLLEPSHPTLAHLLLGHDSNVYFRSYRLSTLDKFDNAPLHSFKAPVNPVGSFTFGPKNPRKDWALYNSTKLSKPSASIGTDTKPSIVGSLASVSESIVYSKAPPTDTRSSDPKLNKSPASAFDDDSSDFSDDSDLVYFSDSDDYSEKLDNVNDPFYCNTIASTKPDIRTTKDYLFLSSKYSLKDSNLDRFPSELSKLLATSSTTSCKSSVVNNFSSISSSTVSLPLQSLDDPMKDEPVDKLSPSSVFGEDFNNDTFETAMDNFFRPSKQPRMISNVSNHALKEIPSNNFGIASQQFPVSNKTQTSSDQNEDDIKIKKIASGKENIVVQIPSTDKTTFSSDGVKNNIVQQVTNVLLSAWTVKNNCSCDDCKYTSPSHIAVLRRRGIMRHKCHVCRRHQTAVSAIKRQLAICICLSCVSYRKGEEKHSESYCPCHHCAGSRHLSLAMSGRKPARSLLTLLRVEDVRPESEGEDQGIGIQDRLKLRRIIEESGKLRDPMESSGKPTLR